MNVINTAVLYPNEYQKRSWYILTNQLKSWRKVYLCNVKAINQEKISLRKKRENSQGIKYQVDTHLMAGVRVGDFSIWIDTTQFERRLYQNKLSNGIFLKYSFCNDRIECFCVFCELISWSYTYRDFKCFIPINVSLCNIKTF